MVTTYLNNSWKCEEKNLCSSWNNYHNQCQIFEYPPCIFMVNFWKQSYDDTPRLRTGCKTGKSTIAFPDKPVPQRNRFQPEVNCQSARVDWQEYALNFLCFFDDWATIVHTRLRQSGSWCRTPVLQGERWTTRTGFQRCLSNELRR